MFKRQTTGSVVCRSCGKLVAVSDDRCWACGAVRPGLWGFAPLLRRLEQDLSFVQLVTFGCVGLYVATLLIDAGAVRMGGPLSMLSPSPRSLFLFGASGALPVFGYGQWWTVLSAAWLHGGLLHILFNMLWVRQLAPVAGHLYGAGRTVIIYTAGSVVGFSLSSFAGAFLPPILGGAGLTIGASAPIFGLLAALVHYGRRGGSSVIGQQAWGWAVMLFVFGFMMPGVDNWAHLGGFVGGYAAAGWLDPRRPERTDHLVTAAVCLLLTVLAVLTSLLNGWALVGR